MIIIIIILLIMLPLFGGYVFTYDMSWGEHLNTVGIESNTWLLYEIINKLQLVVYGSIIQSAVLVSIIALAYLGSYRLLQYMVNFSLNKSISNTITLLYIFNPFFYTRFVAGQWLVLLGYALLPWAIKSIYIFLKDPHWKTTWPVIVWTAAIGLTSIHTIAIVAVAGIGLVIYFGRGQWKLKIKYGLLIALGWIVLNTIWLVPFISGQSATSQSVASFDQSQVQAFATQGTVAGSVPLSAALLTGFWADDQNRYILPSSLPIWWIGVVIVMSLIIAGMVLVIKRRDRLGITFLVLAIVAWLLGMGIAWPPSAVITDLLIKIFPYYKGYREPQKWLMLLSLCYVYFAAIGASRIYEYITQKWKSDYIRYAFITLLAITPFLFAPTLAWGAAGQLKSADYPRGWYETKQYLNKENVSSGTKPQSTNILVLPWHMYLPISFTGRVVANPSGYFFDQHMITGDNFELAGVPPQNQTATTKYISNELLPNSANHVEVGTKLKARNIQYVLLLKEADWKNYGWLNSQTDLTIVQDNASVRLYEISLGSNHE